jgi:hypothetical protein
MCASDNLWPIYLKMTTHLDICYHSSKTNEILSVDFSLSVHLVSLRSFVNVRYDG